VLDGGLTEADVRYARGVADDEMRAGSRWHARDFCDFVDHPSPSARRIRRRDQKATPAARFAFGTMHPLISLVFLAVAATAAVAGYIDVGAEESTDPLFRCDGVTWLRPGDSDADFELSPNSTACFELGGDVSFRMAAPNGTAYDTDALRLDLYANAPHFDTLLCRTRFASPPCLIYDWYRTGTDAYLAIVECDNGQGGFPAQPCHVAYACEAIASNATECYCCGGCPGFDRPNHVRTNTTL